MGWVVKSLRGEALEALAAAGASGVLRDADRVARRIRRSAARDAGQTLAALAALETLGLETRERVRAERRRLRAGRATPAIRAAGVTGPQSSPTPAGRALGATVAEPSPTAAVRAGAPLMRAAGSVRRRGRASLRESPVVELFRRT